MVRCDWCQGDFPVEEFDGGEWHRTGMKPVPHNRFGLAIREDRITIRGTVQGDITTSTKSPRTTKSSRSSKTARSTKSSPKSQRSSKAARSTKSRREKS